MTPLALAGRARSLARRLLATRPAVVALDFDGTLTAIVDDPRAPRLTADQRELLQRLVAVDGLHVAIVSGRALSDVRDRVGVAGATVVGNHGFEMDGWTAPGVAAARPSLQAFLASLAEGDLPPLEVEDKGATVTLHLRGERTPEARDAVLALLRERLGAFPPEATRRPALRLHPGKSSVEVRPALEWDKARALLALLERWDVAPAHALYAGDDATDECVFEALREGITIRVGSGDTAAGFVARGPEDVYGLLREIAASRGRA